jgi:hypothetical protein
MNWMPIPVMDDGDGPIELLAGGGGGGGGGVAAAAAPSADGAADGGPLPWPSGKQAFARFEVSRDRTDSQHLPRHECPVSRSSWPGTEGRLHNAMQCNVARALELRSCRLGWEQKCCTHTCLSVRTAYDGRKGGLGVGAHMLRQIDTDIQWAHRLLRFSRAPLQG